MSGTDKLSPRPMDNTDADASYVQGPLQIGVGPEFRTGGDTPGHPELSKSLKDAVAARIADAETNGEYTAFPYPNHAGASITHAPVSGWSTQKLATGE